MKLSRNDSPSVGGSLMILHVLLVCTLQFICREKFWLIPNYLVRQCLFWCGLRGDYLVLSLLSHSTALILLWCCSSKGPGSSPVLVSCLACSAVSFHTFCLPGTKGSQPFRHTLLPCSGPFLLYQGNGLPRPLSIPTPPFPRGCRHPCGSHVCSQV